MSDKSRHRRLTRRTVLGGIMLATVLAGGAYAILQDIMPISRRARGMLHDAEAAGQPADMDFAGLRVPTLILSVEDDRFGTAETARWLAAIIPDAISRIYPTGGHIWLGHDEDVADEIARFVAAHRDRD